MLLVNDFSQTIEVLRCVETETDLNPVRTWELAETKWAIVVQLRPEADQKVNYHQAWDAQRMYRVMVRGQQNYDLANTRLRWKQQNITFEIISSEFCPGNTKHQLGVYTCRRVDVV